MALAPGRRIPDRHCTWCARQPAGEPGTPRVEQLAPDEARRGRRRDVPAATGERTTPGRPLEVLRRECPPGWWHYFEVVGHRREGQADALDRQSGTLTSGILSAHHNRAPKDAGILGAYGSAEGERGFGDSGGASRFFYTAKATSAERPRVDGIAHPTVKPLDLMRWLARLVTPPGGLVLDPFAGSGTTGEAAIVEGFRVWLIEREADYLPLILHRIERAQVPLDFTEAS